MPDCVKEWFVASLVDNLKSLRSSSSIFALTAVPLLY